METTKQILYRNGDWPSLTEIVRTIRGEAYVLQEELQAALTASRNSLSAKIATDFASTLELIALEIDIPICLADVHPSRIEVMISDYLTDNLRVRVTPMGDIATEAPDQTDIKYLYKNIFKSSITRNSQTKTKWTPPRRRHKPNHTEPTAGLNQVCSAESTTDDLSRQER